MPRDCCSGTMGRRCNLVALMQNKKSTVDNADLYTQIYNIVQKSKNIKINARQCPGCATAFPIIIMAETGIESLRPGKNENI